MQSLINVTQHAMEMGKKRFNLDFSTLAKLAEDSLNEGIDALHDEVFRPMCLAKAKKYNASGMYCYKGIIFVFIEQHLVTVYPLAYLNDYVETNSEKEAV